MKTLHTLLLLLLVGVLNQAAAKKPPQPTHKQLIPLTLQTRANEPQKIIRHSTAVAAGESLQSGGKTDHLSTARQYIDQVLQQQPQLNAAEVDLVLVSERQGLALNTYRFQQQHQGLEVIDGHFTVSINQQGVVRHASHQLFATDNLQTPKKLLSDDQVMSRVTGYFNHQQARQKSAARTAKIWAHGDRPRLVWQVNYAFDQDTSRWLLLVDANDGEVIKAIDNKHYNTVPVNVFDPDPLSSSGQSYGGGLVDGGDANTPELTAQLQSRTLEVLHQDDRYFITNEWAESIDISEPLEGDYSQDNDDFLYNRSDPSFEAVNIAWHLNEYMSYLNNTLGLNVRPYQYDTGVRFDAHARNNADASSYFTGDGTLEFGQGCVDDGEDADVIIHELGHGIHDWVTDGNLSQVDGLSEGLGDYFAQSYSRSRPGYAWTPADPEYHQVFSWDGHNECWGGRITNDQRTYPDDLVGQIHTDGQIWSSCLMNIWETVGRERTDTMVIEGLAMTDSNTGQQDAAQAMLLAAEELGYTDDLLFIGQSFQSCGYNINLPQGQLTVQINASDPQPELGQQVTFSASVAGASGLLSFAWDINGDGHTDGTQSSITVTYSQAFAGTVQVLVQDVGDQFGFGQLALKTDSPDIQISAAGDLTDQLQQVCGNDDQVIDPGERWQLELAVSNQGTQAANDAWLALSGNRSLTFADGRDQYGNLIASCERTFIDITESGTLHEWQAAGSEFTAADEGFVTISLADSFDHYGETINTLVASTNGYLSTSVDANGSDWSPDCPLPANPDFDSVGGRIIPFHSDLRDALFYHQSFTDCPRLADDGNDQSCEVFSWLGADLWATSGAVEAIDVQAILYPATSQWVFQYGGEGFSAANPTIGLQNAAADDGYAYTCNGQNNISDSAAVCVINAAFAPPLVSSITGVSLESPVISLADVGINQTRQAMLNFAVTEDASCGLPIGFDHQASVFLEGFNTGNNGFFTTQVGDDQGLCEAVNDCGVGISTERSESNDVKPRNGLWWNPARSGNGVDLHVSNQQSMLSVMYTAREDRSPIWYLANGADSANNQYRNDLYEVLFPGGFALGDQRFSQVGWAETTFIDDSRAVQVREINGQLSADLMVLDQFAADQTPNMHTGHYFSPEQDGWGQSVITLGTARVVISYIYDLLGNPMWTISSGTNDSSTRDVFHAKAFCPHCPVLLQEGEQIGTLGMEFNGQQNGQINQYIISYPPAPMQPQATWDIRDLTIFNVVPAEQD
ncbi:hypothetical protein ACFODZ_11260 [Marinicella sediminis]|uniref:FTP domain-containing protein n=1 Tax=Marinicella sediminis TaxID=1792834 RepID=A0ABV7JDI6_9GAMM|nr:hypothetical protein [Marinicella sediminis]